MTGRATSGDARAEDGAAALGESVGRHSIGRSGGRRSRGCGRAQGRAASGRASLQARVENERMRWRKFARRGIDARRARAGRERGSIRPGRGRRGEVLFAKEWVPNDPLSHGGDGLGPVFNETSCVACHGLGAPAAPGPESKNVVLVTAIPNGCGPSTCLDQVHPGFRGSRSAVLHRYGTDPEYVSWRSASSIPHQQRSAKAAARIAARTQSRAGSGRSRSRPSPDRRHARAIGATCRR